jgi:hypothetical protein
VAPPDPRLGAALVLNGGPPPGMSGRDRADPAKWEALKSGGYRYRADAPGPRRAPHRLPTGAAQHHGARRDVACDLLATAQRTPVSVVRADDVRYCAAFTPALRNEQGRFTARNAVAPASCPDTDLTVADLNILHGIFCPMATQRAARRARRPL